MTIFAAIIVAIIAWWVSTGLVIMIVRGLGGRALALTIASVVAIVGAIGMWASRDVFTQVGVYHGFFAALALWAFHEVTFLTGTIVGPRRTGVDPNVDGAARFRAAFMAIRDHEVALFVTGLLLIGIFVGFENPTGWLTYGLLWLMRVSTKLNVFYGAPNAISEILPERLSYLTSYFRTDRIHPVFIASVALITTLMTMFAFFAAQSTGGAAVLWTLLATFAALALLEHLFLVLPIRDAALWWWAVGDQNSMRAAHSADAETTRKKKQKWKAGNRVRFTEIRLLS